MDFVAFDFETASAKRASACSLALVIVRDNQIVDELYSLINPQTEFNYRNVQIHGIREQDVQDAPTFGELWPHLAPFFTANSLVIAHNAPFDNGVLKASLTDQNLTLPTYQSLDTVRTSRKLSPELPNHKLNTVAAAYDIDLHHHHNALDDAHACAEILIHQVNQFGSSAITPLIKNIN